MKEVLQIDFAETIKFIKATFIAKNRVNIFLILIGIAVVVTANIYKNRKEEQYNQFKIEMTPIIGIASNKDKLNFIQRHSFSGKCADINKYIQRIFRETYANLTDIEKVSETKIGKISVHTIKISGIFWHDVFIFDFLDKIQNFSPGFVNIISININKLARKITHKPIIKLEMICKIFQKL